MTKTKNTSISLPAELLDNTRVKLKAKAMTLSGYVRTLIEKDNGKTK